jgi:hypothetical protein
MRLEAISEPRHPAGSHIRLNIRSDSCQLNHSTFPATHNEEGETGSWCS